MTLRHGQVGTKAHERNNLGMGLDIAALVPVGAINRAPTRPQACRGPIDRAHRSVFHVDAPQRTINNNGLPISDVMESALRVDYRRNSILTCNNGTVRKLTADFQHNAAHKGKDWRPTGIGCLCYQDIALGKPCCFRNTAYNACRTPYSTTTGGYSLQKCPVYRLHSYRCPICPYRVRCLNCIPEVKGGTALVHDTM